MAPRAAPRSRFVRGLRWVAGDARRTIVARRSLVGNMTAGALVMPGHPVQARPFTRGVAGSARRRARNPTGSVRAVTGRAVDVRSVTELGLFGVAACTRRGRTASSAMWIMAALASLMTARRGSSLRRVAGHARSRWSCRLMGCVAMARRAVGVTCGDDLGLHCVTSRAGGYCPRWLVCRGRVTGRARGVTRRRRGGGLLWMARHAERCCRDRFSLVRPVTVEATRRRMLRLVVTALARHRDHASGEGVGRMAASARIALRRCGRMRDPLEVTGGARLRLASIVRRVTAGALRVLRDGEDRLLRVATRAGGDVLLAKCVRRVTSGAAGVSGRQRLRFFDARAASLLCMTSRAALVGGKLRLVHRVTIEASPGAGVPRVVILVTARARGRLQRRRTVSAVAITARLICVRADRRDMDALRLIMATHARRRTNGEIGSEPVAVLARRRFYDAEYVDSVQRSRHLTVAAATEIDWRRCEAPLTMTVAARDIGTLDMRAMPGTLAHGAPNFRHVLWNTVRPGLAARGDDQHEREDAYHQRLAPTG